jgi:hypothetical protein
MANAFYPSFLSSLLTADIDPIADNIKMVLVDSGYAYSSAHDNLDDVGAGARIATSGNLATKTSTDGYFDSDLVTFPDAPGGDTIAGIVMYKDSGSEATSKLMVFYDTNAASAAISVATDGGDVTLTPNASGWFKL